MGSLQTSILHSDGKWVQGRSKPEISERRGMQIAYIKGARSAQQTDADGESEVIMEGDTSWYEYEGARLLTPN